MSPQLELTSRVDYVLGLHKYMMASSLPHDQGCALMFTPLLLLPSDTSILTCSLHSRSCPMSSQSICRCISLDQWISFSFRLLLGLLPDLLLFLALLAHLEILSARGVDAKIDGITAGEWGRIAIDSRSPTAKSCAEVLRHVTETECISPASRRPATATAIHGVDQNESHSGVREARGGRLEGEAEDDREVDAAMRPSRRHLFSSSLPSESVSQQGFRPALIARRYCLSAAVELRCFWRRLLPCVPRHGLDDAAICKCAHQNVTLPWLATNYNVALAWLSGSRARPRKE